MTSAAERVRALDWSALESLNLDEPLEQILSGAPAERVIDRFFRAHRDFSSEQRRVAKEALFGVGLWRRRLQAQGGPPLQALTHLGEDPPGFADRHSLPDWLAAEILRTDDPEALADAFNLPGPICLRARDDVDELARSLAARGIETRRGRYAPKCLVVTSLKPNLLGLNRNDFEVQDEGSQLLGELVAPKAGEHILDLCAGAGGKTLQLAAALNGRGTVHACDIDTSKIERLRHRAFRAGASNVVIHGAVPPADLKVDAVLVDAPCSELGVLRRGPDVRWRIDPKSFAELPALQLQLLETAARHATQRIVYATCTFRREENEEVCARFEAKHPEFQRKSPFFHCWPHIEDTDAFFGSIYERV